jgi:Lar family restriction alleviation protein
MSTHTPGPPIDVTKHDSRLHPCPFCGEKRVVNWLSHDAAPNVWCVFCESCNAEGPHANDEDVSVSLWNRRAVECAEEDLFGQALEALRWYADRRTWDQWAPDSFGDRARAVLAKAPRNEAEVTA